MAKIVEKHSAALSLIERAERCHRLANSNQTNEELARQFRALAAEYERMAAAVTRVEVMIEGISQTKH